MDRREFCGAVLVTATMQAIASNGLAEQRRIVGRYILQTVNFQCVCFGRNDGYRAEYPGCKNYDHENYSLYERAFLESELPRGQQAKHWSFEDFAKTAFEEQQFYRDHCPDYPHEVHSLEAR